MKLPRTWLLIALLTWLPASHAHQVSYSIPRDLTGSPFNCSYSAGLYTCPSITLGHHTVLYVTAPVDIKVNGTFSADHHFVTSNNGNKLTLDVTGSLTIAHQSSVELDLDKVGGSAHIAHHTSVKGNVSVGGSLQIDHQSLIIGNVVTGGDLVVGSKSSITGTCTVGGTTAYRGCGAAPPVANLHHIRIEHASTGVTCAPSTITIKACSGPDSGGTCTPFTDGVSGTILAASSQSQEIDYEIPDDSSETTITLSSSTPRTFTLSSPDTAYTCWNGTSNSCQLEFEQAGFEFSGIPNHSAGAQQTATLSAIASSPSRKTCAPAFTSATPVTFRCTYNNPTSGSSITLTFGSTATTFTCGTDRSISVPFDGNGKAEFKLTYPDVGNITLTASANSNMSGQDSFIAAPASFRLTAASNPIRAGLDSNLTVEALTTTASVRAKSFGLESGTPESVKLSFKRCQPNIGSPNDGIFTSNAGGFSDGQATYTIRWSEIGNGDLTAALLSGNYLGSSLAPTGILAPSTGACASTDGALTSVPHHFMTETAQPVYTYSGQPMKVIVTAHAAHAGPPNGSEVTTNYYLPGSGASKTVRTLTFGAWNGTTSNPGGGTWDSSVPILISALANEPTRGKISFTRTYTLPNKFTAPVNATIRVNDTYATSMGYEEATTNIRNGRLRLSNAFGSVTQDLNIPVMAQYWSGSSWILNADDNYTTVPLPSIALTRSGAASTSNAAEIPVLTNGQGRILITRPTSGTAGTVDVAVNLGYTTSQDVSCLPGTHPTTVGNRQPWLRHTFGSCAAPADPTARATFGVYPGQTKRTIYVREAFD
jgi:MSHA biogenesis protein MshQ